MLAIDGLDHAQHLSGLGFRRLLIRGEIKLRQGWVSDGDWYVCIKNKPNVSVAVWGMHTNK